MVKVITILALFLQKNNCYLLVNINYKNYLFYKYRL